MHLQLSGDWYVPLSGYHKAQKRSLRRKCEDYAVDSGVLYRKKKRERGEMEFLRVPRGVEERERSFIRATRPKKVSMISSVMDWAISVYPKAERWK